MNELIKVTMYMTTRGAFFIAFSIFAIYSIGAQITVPENSKSEGLSWDLYNPIQISFIDSLRNAIKGSVTSPDEFLYENFSDQLDLTTLDMRGTDTLVRYVMTAEACKNAKNYLPAEQATLFEAMGDKMLSKLADTLTAGIQLGTFDPTNEDVAYLIRRLSDNHYLINVKVSNLKKTWDYIREGRFGYVFHKLTTTYKTEFMKFLGGMIALVLLSYFRKNIVRSIKLTLSQK